MNLAEVILGADFSKEILDDIERGVQRAAQGSAEAVADDVRANVKRRTGATAASVEAHEDGSVSVGGAIGFLEFGTVKMPASPTVVPAFEKERDRFERKLKGA